MRQHVRLHGSATAHPLFADFGVFSRDHADTPCLCVVHSVCSQVARQHCSQEVGVQVLMPWVTRPEDIKLVQQAGHKVEDVGLSPLSTQHYNITKTCLGQLKISPTS
jgi:hypothetical protein